MGSSEFLESHMFKNIMAKVYGMGAAVVIVGALFKIMHWPGANEMLILGLGTEAVIFTISSFEPLHEEVDWSLAYPILGGASLDDEIAFAAETGAGTKTNATLAVPQTEALERFNNMLDKAGEKGIFEKFGESLGELNGKVAQMSDISDAALATNEYSKNMKTAAKSVENFSENYQKSVESVADSAQQLSETYKQSAETISYSVDNLSDAYGKAAVKVNEGNDELSNAYQRLTQSMDLDFSELKAGNGEYGSQITTLNKNLTALNAIFELQLNEADLDKMMSDLNTSVEESNKYAGEITKLRENLQALNSIYGNMLSAMTFKG
ncbi:MAG: gliding motility protein GldL [Bacteroidales bacterium]|nr:gliding motility protein GldL [Bacteroidales bacterium]